jgi:hypothetical protein
VEINFLSERLDDGHHPWAKLSAGCGLEVFDEGLTGQGRKDKDEFSI